MVRIKRTLKAVAIGIAIASSSAFAQGGSSMSLVHTVSVTVPPRVKVQVAGAPVSTGSATRAVANSATQGLAVSVAATRAWVLSSGNVVVASGGLPTDSQSARVFFRKPVTESESRSGSADAPIVLTIAAP